MIRLWHILFGHPTDKQCLRELHCLCTPGWFCMGCDLLGKQANRLLPKGTPNGVFLKPEYPLIQRRKGNTHDY